MNALSKQQISVIASILCVFLFVQFFFGSRNEIDFNDDNLSLFDSTTTTTATTLMTTASTHKTTEPRTEEQYVPIHTRHPRPTREHIVPQATTSTTHTVPRTKRTTTTTKTKTKTTRTPIATTTLPVFDAFHFPEGPTKEPPAWATGKLATKEPPSWALGKASNVDADPFKIKYKIPVGQVRLCL